MVHTLGEQESLEHLISKQLLNRLGRQPSQDSLISISIDDSLSDDLGLMSRELFELIAELNENLQIDPFVKDHAITDIRTVSDLCRIYQNALDPVSANTPSSSNTNDELLNSRNRAQARLQSRAQARLQSRAQARHHHRKKSPLDEIQA